MMTSRERFKWPDYFGADKLGYIGMDHSPRYPAKVLEETAEYYRQTGQGNLRALRYGNQRT
ncbi:MAG: hypothetical protein FWE62_05565 [Firmicutes bacterium]|nr:hypothetical protein [Bacillota bacterium]